MSRNRTAIVALAALTITANAMAQQPIEWKYWTLGESQITINLPTKPTLATPQESPVLGTATVIEGTVADPVFTYSVAFYDRPLKGLFDYDNWGKEVERNFSEQPGHKRGGILPVPTPGLTSKFVVHDVVTREGHRFTSILGAVGTQKHVVILSITYDNRSEAAMKMSTKIMDSLRMVSTVPK